MENYKLYLYKPNATGDNFLGELLVDNLQVNIKLHEMSSISFTIPENVNGVANQRLDEVLDGYVVELWYGRVTGVENTDYSKMRFILHTTPLDFNDFKRTYTYEGFSFESILEFKQIDNWAGVKTKDFYRLMTYDNSTTDQYTEVAATGETIPNHPYSVTAKTIGTGNYIRIAPTTATATPLDIYVYEVREDTSTEAYNEIPYVRYTGVTYNEANFKQGYYFLDMDVNEQYVEYIYIYVPDNYDDFDAQASNKKLRFKVYDNPISRHYAIGVNRNDDNPYTNMYIDLAQDAEDGDPAEYGDYTFVTQSVYSKNGLKLEHVLLGNIESRDAGLIDNDALTLDGLLYNTDFTIGTIHADIAVKYRSNLEYNNITVYQAIRDLAESFDAIPVFDTILKTVSFYPENADTWPNNGLILKYGTYLKTINKDIDASKIVTAAKGIGKDNLSIALITPDGSNSWQDFSYYLDEFYIDPELSLSELNALGFEFTLETSSGLNYLGISYPDSDNTSTYQSRWMEAVEAKKVAKWQFNRDFMHKVLLGEIRPSDVDYGALNLTALNRYYDLYNIRSEAINDYVQSETVLSVKKAESFRYKYLYDHYEKLVIAGSTVPEDLERLNYYKNLWTQTQSLVLSEEAALEQKRVAIFETENPVADSIADKMSEVRIVLNKVTIYSINITKLNPFIKEAMVSDTKFDNELDLLDAVITHVNENKIPRITINVSIVDILAAQEAYDDWNKLRVGDLVNIYYPEFNIDVEVQIREVSIDFEGHTASIVISSVRNYNKGYANYVSKVIKRLSITEKNVVNNLQDANRTSSNESNQNFKTLNGGQISTANANIIFGSKNDGGTSSTSFSGSGFESKTVESVDPLTESFVFGVDKSVVIKDGTILAYYRDDADTFTSEVEISADKGFEIRKITGSLEGEDLLSVRKVYIDTNGNAVFEGTVNANAGNFTSTVSVGSGATSGTINVGTDTNKIVITGTNNDETTKIYSGTGTYNNSNTGFYLDASGRFSLGDQLYWNGTTLTILGDIQADTGTIGGFYVGADYIRAADVNTKLLLKHNVNTPYLSIGQSTNTYESTGIFLGMVSDGQPSPTYAPKFSLVSEGDNYLKWTGEDLLINGNLGGEISAILINDITIDENGIRAEPSTGVYSFYLNASDGTGGIGAWNFDADAIYTGTKTENEEFTITPGHITFGSDGHISSNQFRIDADGSAIFKGSLEAASGSFGSVTIDAAGSLTIGNTIIDNNGINAKNESDETNFSVDPETGEITSIAGQIAGWTISSTSLSSGNTSGNYLGMSPGAGTGSDISFWAGAIDNTSANISAAPFRVTNLGALTSTSGTIGGWSINTDRLSSNDAILFSGDSQTYFSVGQSIVGYGQDGVFIGTTYFSEDNYIPAFSLENVTEINNQAFEGTYSQGDTTIGNWTASSGVYLDYTTAPSNSLIIDDYDIRTTGGVAWGFNNFVGNYFLFKGLTSAGSYTETLVYTPPSGATKKYSISYRVNIKRNGGSSSSVEFRISTNTGYIRTQRSFVGDSWRSDSFSLPVGTTTITFTFFKGNNAQALIGVDNIVVEETSGLSYDTESGLIVSGGKIAEFNISPTSITAGTTSTFETLTTNFYADKDGKFSLANMFSWDGNTGISSKVKIKQPFIQANASGYLDLAFDNGTYITSLRATPATSNKLITLPDAEGTVALLQTSQTFTGIKTFSAEPVFTAGAVFGSAADAANSIEITSTGNIIFEGSSGGADANETVLTVVNPTADQTYQIPNKTAGTYTVATIEDLVVDKILSAADFTTSSPSFVNVSDGTNTLNLSLEANSTYEVQLTGLWKRDYIAGSSNSLTISLVFDSVSGTAPTTIGHWYYSQLDASTAYTISNTLYTASISDNQPGNTLTTVTSSTDVNNAAIGLKAIINTGSAARVVTLRAVQNTSAPSTVGLKRYSSFTARKL